MTAVGVRENAGPRTTADVDRMFDSAWQQAHTNRSAPGEERREPIDWKPGMNFAFRTHPGPVKGQMTVHIDWKEPDWGFETDTKEGKAKARLLQLWEQRHKDDDPEWLATLERAYYANGGRHKILFTAIEHNYESYYQTNDPDIAAVIRAFMRSGEGDGRYLYEVFPNREIKVGTKRFEDTHTGLQAALAFMAEIGGELKYVVKGTDKPFKGST